MLCFIIDKNIQVHVCLLQSFPLAPAAGQTANYSLVVQLATSLY